MNSPQVPVPPRNRWNIRKVLLVSGVLLFQAAGAVNLYRLFELTGPVKQVEITYQEDLASVQDASYETLTFNQTGTQAVHTIFQPIGFEHSRGTYLWNPSARTLHMELIEDNQKYGTWDSLFDAKGCELRTTIWLVQDPRKRTELRECNPQGRVIKQKSHVAGEAVPRVVRYQHQAGGLVLEVPQHASEDSWNSYQVLDAHGLVIEDGGFQRGEKDPNHRYTYVFDARGNWIQKLDFGWLSREGKWDPAPYKTTFRKIMYR